MVGIGASILRYHLDADFTSCRYPASLHSNRLKCLFTAANSPQRKAYNRKGGSNRPRPTDAGTWGASDDFDKRKAGTAPVQHTDPGRGVRPAGCLPSRPRRSAPIPPDSRDTAALPQDAGSQPGQSSGKGGGGLHRRPRCRQHARPADGDGYEATFRRYQAMVPLSPVRPPRPQALLPGATLGSGMSPMPAPSLQVAVREERAAGCLETADAAPAEDSP